MVFKLTVPGHPPTVNHIWKAFGKRRFKTKEYLAWEMLIGYECARLQTKKDIKSMGNRPYQLIITLFQKTWRTKAGTIKRPDTPNMIKAAEDAVCKYFDWEDSWNISTLIKKCEGPEYDSEHGSTEIEFHFDD